MLACVSSHLMIIVKDCREEQSSKGCWHICDIDFLYENSLQITVPYVPNMKVITKCCVVSFFKPLIFFHVFHCHNQV